MDINVSNKNNKFGDNSYSNSKSKNGGLTNGKI